VVVTHHEAEHYNCTDELDRIRGKRRPGNSTPAPSGCPWRQVGGKVGGTYLRPKDSNAAVGVRERATGKALEGADRETNRLSPYHSKDDCYKAMQSTTQMSFYDIFGLYHYYQFIKYHLFELKTIYMCYCRSCGISSTLTSIVLDHHE